MAHAPLPPSYGRTGPLRRLGRTLFEHEPGFFDVPEARHLLALHESQAQVPQRADGGNLILELRADMFKFGPERRTTFTALNSDKKTLCALGFEAIKLKEDRAFGNEDIWSLGCDDK